MIVNVEFLDEDSIENAITSMNYAIDKAIFVGFKEMIEEKQDSLTAFLKKYGGVKEILFVEIPPFDMDCILEKIRGVIEKELEEKNDLFFDITGGDSIALVAFGLLAEEYQLPLHIYNVEKNQIFEVNHKDRNLSELATKKVCKLNLDSYIELYGGIINYRLKKDYKSLSVEKDSLDVEKMWAVSKKYKDNWNHFASFLARIPAQKEPLLVKMDAKEMLALLKEQGKMKPKLFNGMLDALAEQDILRTVIHENGRYCFTYKNELVRDSLLDPGSILELYTYMYEMKHSDCSDCRIGVHLDWDGIDHPGTKIDVLNEIDVLSLNGNIATFISCKNGQVDQKALYELETVANQFGGRYAKKKLVVSKQPAEILKLRAEEMDIEIQVMK